MKEVTFKSMQVSEPVLKALDDLGFERPTPVQAETIPPMLQWYDIIAKAPTGTGKTCAFGIPILEHLEPDTRDPQALILAPTRELAMQIADDITTFARHMPEVKIAAIYGGQNIRRQFDQLNRNPQIIVATPGRLMDHMERGTLRLDAVHTAVLDEADRMLDMGFVHDVRKILDMMPDLSQLSLFSATMSREVLDIAWIYQRDDAVEITIPEDEENRPQIQQYKLTVTGRNRLESIANLIRGEKHDRVLIFCNTKHMVNTVTRRLAEMGLKTDCIHGDIQQRTREKVIAGFRSGKIPVMVATDVAARGLDIDDVDAVFNYDIPNENESYTHRIGRTGRAKKTGVAYTFVSALTAPRLEEIEKYTNSEIEFLDVLEKYPLKHSTRHDSGKPRHSAHARPEGSQKRKPKSHHSGSGRTEKKKPDKSSKKKHVRTF